MQFRLIFEGKIVTDRSKFVKTTNFLQYTVCVTAVANIFTCQVKRPTNVSWSDICLHKINLMDIFLVSYL